MTSVLALDVGTSSTRALLYDERGREVEGTLERAEVDPERMPGEANANEMLDAALRVVSAAEGSHEVDAKGISSFWHSLVAVDAAVQPLTPVFTWEDVRASPQAARLAAELDGAAVHQRTGCALHPSYWPAKLVWLREVDPDAFARATWFLSFPDLLFHRLTGELGTSASIASGSGLLDLAAGRWDEELLAATGVSAARLPRLLDESEALGGWYPPVGDGACSNVGAGCVTHDRAALMIGTSGAYRVVHEQNASPLDPGLFRYVLDRARVVEGGALSNGGNVPAWLTRTLQLDDTPDFGDPGSHGLTVLPLLGGERSPGWRGGARGVIQGLSFETTAAEIFQAALEGVACRFAEIVDLVPGVSEIVATGGALREEPRWGQILADAIGRPLVLSGVHESSARGAAVLALARLGVEADDAPVGDTVEPDPRQAGVYEAMRERQRALYETLA